MAHTFTLGRLFGIRIAAHVSWLAVFAFVTCAIAQGLAPLGPRAAYGFAAVCALALFASVVAHELAHALTARRFGVRTHAIALFLFGGVAVLDDEPATPGADAAIALAGPALSAAIALLAFGALVALDRVAPEAAAGVPVTLGAYVAIANGVLAAFNLIPAYPMDGGRVFRALCWLRMRDRARATAYAARVGVGFALLFVGAAVLVVAARHSLFYGWYAVLGTFLLRQSWAQSGTPPKKEPAITPAGDVAA